MDTPPGSTDSDGHCMAQARNQGPPLRSRPRWSHPRTTRKASCPPPSQRPRWPSTVATPAPLACAAWRPPTHCSRPTRPPARVGPVRPPPKHPPMSAPSTSQDGVVYLMRHGWRVCGSPDRVALEVWEARGPWVLRTGSREAQPRAAALCCPRAKYPEEPPSQCTSSARPSPSCLRQLPLPHHSTCRKATERIELERVGDRHWTGGIE